MRADESRAAPGCDASVPYGKFLNRVVFMDEHRAFICYFLVSPAQRGSADAEITVSSAQTSELSKILPVKSGESCHN